MGIYANVFKLNELKAYSKIIQLSERTDLNRTADSLIHLLGITLGFLKDSSSSARKAGCAMAMRASARW